MKASHDNLLSVLLAFLKLGLTSFGGPVAHLGYFRQEFVVRRSWFSESEYAQLVAIGQFLPGPASSQVGFAIGLLRAGWLGALTAFCAFTIPSVIIMVLIAMVLPELGNEYAVSLIDALKLIACIIVADAVHGMFRQFCNDWPKRLIALVSLLALVFLSANMAMMLVLVIAGIIGWLFFHPAGSDSVQTWKAPFSSTLAYALLGVFAGLFLLSLYYSTELATGTGVFAHFYLTGSLVFGGGHVVLPLLENQWVTTGVITSEDFLSGYGAAQLLPGPLFSFAAYLATLIANVVPEISPGLAISLALAGIFLPGFLLMAAVLPLWLRISNSRSLNGAISAINAAVVGILAAVFIDPVVATGIHDTVDLVIATTGLLILQTKKLSMLCVIGITIVLRMTVTLLVG